MSAFLHRVAGALTIAALLSAWPRAQDAPAFRSTSALVVVPTRVTDRDGRFIRGLSADDFILLEDGKPKPLVQFAATRVPISVAVVLDVSGSMSTEPKRWELTQRATISFLSRLSDEDEVALVAFSDQPQRLVGWTRNAGDVFASLSRARVGGSTALFRTLSGVVPDFRRAKHARKVLLLISDGNDEDYPASKQLTRQEVYWRRAVDAVRRSGVLVYAIGIGRGHQPVDRRILAALSEPTGGYMEVLDDDAMLEAAIARVADDLRDQYTLGFEPSAVDDKEHSIVVRTRIAQHRVRARSGYVASSITP